VFRVRSLLVVLVLGAGIALAPQANADPNDLVPYCSGDQTSMDSFCRETSSQLIVPDGEGPSPNLPYGPDPGNEPAV
jgi:hypothetical protein